MVRLIKKTSAARSIPLMALALFAAVFLGSEVYGSFKKVQEQHWTYNESCGNPASEGCYIPAEEDLEAVCQQQENAVCGINAPDNGSDQPLIQGQLLSDLQSGDFENKDNIFLMPRTE